MVIFGDFHCQRRKLYVNLHELRLAQQALLFILRQRVLPRLEVALIPHVQIVNVGVRHQLAKFVVIVELFIVQLLLSDELGRNVEVKVLGVVSEALVQVVNVDALRIGEVVLVEEVDKRQLTG